MRFALGSDHRGYDLKEKIKTYLKGKGVKYKDFGTFANNSVDYPDFAFKVAKGIANRKFDFGIIACYTGIGMSIAANKVKGIRAALCINDLMAEFARAHNDANVLVLGAKFSNLRMVKKIMTKWLSTQFEGGRHERRLRKISHYENHPTCR